MTALNGTNFSFSFFPRISGHFIDQLAGMTTAPGKVTLMTNPHSLCCMLCKQHNTPWLKSHILHAMPFVIHQQSCSLHTHM